MSETGEVAHLKELIFQRIDSIEKIAKIRQEDLDKALDLKSQSDEKHFSLLNGEADRLRSMQVSYIPREVYETNIESIKVAHEQSNREAQKAHDVFVKEIQKQFYDVHSIIVDLQTFRANALGKLTIVSAVVAAMISWVIVYWK